MCILTSNKKRDGTPFNVTSVMEEDIVEIFIRLGHTHPMGVLCYSTWWNQSFCFDWWMRCNVLAMEPLRQWFYVGKPLPSGLLPLPKHTWGLTWLQWVANLPEPSSTLRGGTMLNHWKSPPRWGNSTQSPGRPWWLSWARTASAYGDLCWEVALCELNAPPEALQQHLGETQQGTGIPMQMTRRSPFQEGRVGSLGTTIPASCPKMARWRMGSPGTTSSTSNSCSS